MLDRLIESKSLGKDKNLLNRLQGAIFTLTVIAVTLAFTYSLFSVELNLGSGDLDMTSFAAPTMIEEPVPEPQEVRKQQSTEKVTSETATRRDNIQRPEESPVKPPEAISVTPSTDQARPNMPFNIGKVDSTPNFSGSNTNKRERNEGDDSEGISTEQSNLPIQNEKEMPVIKQPEKQPEKKKEMIVSGGVVNGKAINLVTPVYPRAAIQVQARGKVEVQVTIDEKGRVIAANVISGHTLLRDAALRAARATSFSPTYLSKEPVKVTGIIVYNFNAQ